MAGEKLRAGIEAVRRGDKVEAQRLLRQVVDQQPQNEVAWMWLASVTDNLDERRQILETVLRINPNNTRAQEALQQIETALGVKPRRGSPRPSQTDLPRVPAGTSRFSLPVIAAIGVGIILIIGVILINVNGQQVSQQATQAAAQFLTAIFTPDTPVPTATIDPDTYTATPFLGVRVTPAVFPTFPPTFTPSFTPTVLTATPTPTPYPLSTFTLIYASRATGEQQGALYRMSADGSNNQQAGTSSDGYADIAFSPDQSKVAFVRTITYDLNGQSVTSPELFVAPSSDLAQARQVTQIGSSILSAPSWGPNSIQLVFISNFDGDEELWSITEDGNNIFQITSNDWVDRQPAWSPDGQTILFASEQANGAESSLFEIFRVNPDGTNTQQLTDAAGSSFAPSWSPTGDRITFLSDRNGDSDVFLMDPNGQNFILVTVDDANAEDREPHFLPDGSQVVFQSNRDGSTAFRLFISPLDPRRSAPALMADPGRPIDSYSFRPEPLLALR